MRRRVVSLYWRVLVINAAILIVAAVLLAFTPFTLNLPIRTRQVLVITEGVLASVLVNGLLLRFGLAPLERLKTAMHKADVLQPGQRLPTTSGVAELTDLAGAFNEMLQRLEEERRASATRASVEREEERRKLARELHDEIGQRLTAVLLYLRRLSTDEAGVSRPELVEAQMAVRQALDEVRRTLRQLRPEALDELGLASALSELTSGFALQTGLVIESRLPPQFPRLAPDEELAIYRVAQEALTNIARHAGATRARITLRRHDRQVIFEVADDGTGFDPSREAGGIRGMRERAIQLGGVLTVGEGDLGGTEVHLLAPLIPDHAQG